MNFSIGFGTVFILLNAGNCSVRLRQADSSDNSREEGFTAVDVSGQTFKSDSLSKLGEVANISIYLTGVEDIEDGAFCSLPTLRKLRTDFLNNQKRFVLAKNTFKNCDKLEELELYGNPFNQSTLHTDALQNLTNLKALTIHGFQIENLALDYCKGLDSLVNLSLEFSSIRAIQPHAFDDLKNLEKLDLSYNYISHLPNDLFRNTPKLKELDLHSNCLSWGEFDALLSLEELDLSYNRISVLNAENVAKNTPNLKQLAIYINPLECKLRGVFANELESKLNHSVQVKYSFCEE